MEHKLQQLQTLGLDTATGIGYTGSPENYIAALAKYAESCEGAAADIEKHLNEGNIQRFMIAVHAVKSNSKMIGNTELFKAFESLEFAAKNNDTAFISANNAAILKKYADFAETIKPIAVKRGEQSAPAISAEEAGEIAGKLLEALDEFDDELSAELAHKLSGYPFGDTEREKLTEARKYIGDFMYDEAAEIIKELTGSIR